MKKGRVVLFNPRPRGYRGEEENYAIPPMSLLALGAVLDREGYEVKIIDQTVDVDYRYRLVEVLEDAICLGITSMTGYQIVGGLEAAQIARKKFPRIPIVWGGYHPSILPEQTVNNPYVDIVVRGQGEITFLELVNSLWHRTSFRNLAGITYKDNGDIISNPDRPVENINNFPPTPYHLINVEKYITQGISSRTIGIRTSQGCPFRCGFCAEVKVTRRRWSGFSSERVLEEIEFLVKRYSVNGLMIYDPNFCVDVGRVREICEGIVKKGFNLSLGNINGRARQFLRFDNSLWQILKEAGCHSVLIGAESGSDELLRLINKDITVRDTIEAKKVLATNGILPFVSLILGFPRMGVNNEAIEQEFNALLDLVDKLQSIDDNNFIRIWNFTPYPGTELYDVALELGMYMPKSLEEWSRYNLTTANVPWIPQKYEKIVDYLNKFIFPYISSQFSTNWEKEYKGRLKPLKRVAHRILRQIARWRLKHRFFRLPIEHILISKAKVRHGS